MGGQSEVPTLERVSARTGPTRPPREVPNRLMHVLLLWALCVAVLALPVLAMGSRWPNCGYRSRS
jgi:hypothetical protein